MTPLPPTNELWEDLVVSMLSVNHYSIEKAYGYLDGLRSAGLCSPDNLISMNVDEIATRLIQAGVDRGSFMTQLYAKRLSALGEAAKNTGVEEFTRILGCNQRSDIEGLLIRIDGIGPRVLQNFFFLRGTSSPREPVSNA